MLVINQGGWNNKKFFWKTGFCTYDLGSHPKNGGRLINRGGIIKSVFGDAREDMVRKW